jgi:hypothetical protein
MTDPITATTAALVATGTVALSTFGQASIEIATKEFWKRVGQICETIRLKLKLTPDNPFDDPELLERIIDCSYEDEVIQKSLKAIGEEIKASSQEQFMTDNHDIIESLQQRLLSQVQIQGKTVISGNTGTTIAPLNSPSIGQNTGSITYNNYSGSPQDI